MADSWEDQEEKVVYKPTTSLNPTAASFSFSPGASSFTPTFAPQAAAAAPPPPPAAPAPPSPPQPAAVQPAPAAPAPPAPEPAAQPSSAAADGAPPAAEQKPAPAAPAPAAAGGCLLPGLGRVEHQPLHAACLPCCRSGAEDCVAPAGAKVAGLLLSAALILPASRASACYLLQP